MHLAAVSCASEPYVIVQIADAQLGFTARAKAQKEGREYDNDVSYEAGYLEKAVAMVNEMKPDVVIFTGDQVHHHDNQFEWDVFADLTGKIDKSVIQLHVPGNHDVAISADKVDMSSFSSRYGSGNFLYEDSGARIVGVNSNLIKYDDPSEAEQLEWLHKILNKKSSRQMTLVFSHHPFFLNEVGENDGYFQIQASKREDYMKLFEECGVDALYAGHLHNNASGSYNGMPVTTTTSVAYQIGDAVPSIRVITLADGSVSDELLPVH